MKVLRLNSYFLLPDDFDGDANDAIQELIKYRKSKKLNKFGYCQKDGKLWSELSEIEKWNTFYDGLIDGYKHIGSVQFSEYNPETKEWTKLD